MNNFTDSPFERMMKERPHPCVDVPRRPKPGTLCCRCSFWRGTPCMNVCYRKLMAAVNRAPGGSGENVSP